MNAKQKIFLLISRSLGLLFKTFLISIFVVESSLSTINIGYVA